MRITASERRVLQVVIAGACASLGLWAQQTGGGAPATGG